MSELRLVQESTVQSSMGHHKMPVEAGSLVPVPPAAIAEEFG